MWAHVRLQLCACLHTSMCLYVCVFVFVFETSTIFPPCGDQLNDMYAWSQSSQQPERRICTALIKHTHC